VCNVGSADSTGLTVAHLKTSWFRAQGDDIPNADDSNNVFEDIKYYGRFIFQVFIKRKTPEGTHRKTVEK
jgi:hypothetical protein